MPVPEKFNPTAKCELIENYWDPKVAAELNGQHFRLAKLKGEFVWHSHEAEDELFWILKGNLRIEFREGVVDLSEGEVLVIPRGVEHRPVAEEEVLVALIEPAETVNTGKVESELTRSNLDTI